MRDKNFKVANVFLLAVRIVAGLVAVGCFLAGLYWVLFKPTRGLILIGAGIVIGVVFGRVPGRASRQDTQRQ